jgi:hypothetical protein
VDLYQEVSMQSSLQTQGVEFKKENESIHLILYFNSFCDRNASIPQHIFIHHYEVDPFAPPLPGI